LYVNYLLESPLPVLVAGAIGLTIAVMVYLSAATRGSQIAIGVVVVATLAGVLVERWIETPREEVAGTLQRLLNAVESNDVPGVLSYLSPQAGDVRTDAETLMPRLDIERANTAGEVEVTLDDELEPQQATVKFKGFIVATDKSSGIRGAYNDGVTVTMEYTDGRWLVRECVPERDWRGEAAKLQRRPPGP
jgi:hypothetical protein